VEVFEKTSKLVAAGPPTGGETNTAKAIDSRLNSGGPMLRS
jgi:hypothetical protein